MQVLDVIDHKLSKEMRKDAAADGDGDQDAESAFPADPEFISLDDIPEAKSSAIDMAEKNDDTREGADDDMMSGPLVVMMNMEVDTDNPDPNKDLRLSCAMMHESGALLLDPCSASHLDMNLLPRKSLATSEIGNSSFSPERIRADQSPSTANVLTGLDNEEAGAAAGGGISPLHVEPEVDYGGDDSDGDAGGLDAPDIDDAEEALNGGGAVLSALHGASTNDVEEEDLWRVLDPHDSSSHAAKPYKKGRTVRRPPPASKSAEAAMSIDLWAKQTRSLKAPTLPEFSEVFLQERNRLLKLRLAAAKACGGARSGRSTHKPPGSGMAVSKMMDLLDLEEEDFDVPVAGGPDGGAFEGGVDSSDDGGGISRMPGTLAWRARRTWSTVRVPPARVCKWQAVAVVGGRRGKTCHTRICASHMWSSTCVALMICSIARRWNRGCATGAGRHSQKSASCSFMWHIGGRLSRVSHNASITGGAGNHSRRLATQLTL